ncbi:hypothetical protein BGX34_002590 [Mortierella sp. NVP85]|nr:hypothetical protein BGX34_002590 [Mortierella sp. NVP85]
MRFHFITLGLILLISAVTAQNSTNLQPYRTNAKGSVRAAGTPKIGSVFSAIKTMIDIYKILKAHFAAPKPDIFVTLVNHHCGSVKVKLVQKDPIRDFTLTEEEIGILNGEMAAVTFSFVPEAPVYVIVLDNSVPGVQILPEMYQFFITSTTTSKPILKDTPKHQVFELKGDGATSYCANLEQTKKLYEECQDCADPEPIVPRPRPPCKGVERCDKEMCVRPEYRRPVATSFNYCLGVPTPKPLSELGIKDGSIIALRNNWPGALNKGRGYLTLCNQCSELVPHIATHSGDSKKNKWSQFKVEFQKKSDKGYQLINLKNMWGNNYLAVCAGCSPGINIGYFSDKPNESPAMWWAAVVEDKNTKKKYLSLMTEYGPLRYQTGKLCETCFSGGRDEFTVSKDSGRQLESYHLYTVEKV